MASIFVFKVSKIIISFELDRSNIRQFHLSFTHFALLYKKWSSAFLHWPSREFSFVLLHGTLNNIGIYVFDPPHVPHKYTPARLQ